MVQIKQEIEYLIGKKIENVDMLLCQHSFEVFSEETLNFLSKISEVLLKSNEIRFYPDVATFAFYCRKSNLNIIKKKYIVENNISIGKGILFHITPSNVPVNFAYSFFAGLITGNINIIKVPSKKFKQVDLIIDAIKNVLKDEYYKSIFLNRIYMVRFNSESEATTFFSSFCDVRIIWGGDNSIYNIRKSQIPSKSTEITFSDRYSIAIINAIEYLESKEKLSLAKKFYNDTYLYDQNACTSPQTIYWLGNKFNVEKAQEQFWQILQDILVQEKYEIEPIVSIDKLTTLFSQAISQVDVNLILPNSNDLIRVKNNSIQQKIEIYKCSSGYFNEVLISSLEDLNLILNRKFQTIGYYGFSKNELSTWLRKSRPLGVDRIVPIGRTMDFSLYWDGYDLFSSLSRIIDIY